MVSNSSQISFNGKLQCLQVIQTKLKAQQARELGRKIVYSNEKISAQEFSKKFNLDLYDLIQYVKTIPVDIELKAKHLGDRFSLILLRSEPKKNMPVLFASSGQMNQKSLNQVMASLKKTARKYSIDDGKPKQLNLLF